MKINLNSIFALLISGMGFMLLLVLVIFERGAFDLLFNIQVGENDAILKVFNALRMVIDVMPYTLGPFILGTFVFGLIQAYQVKWKLLPTLSLIVYFIAIIYNITLADTVAVVETLKNTTNEHTIDTIRYATQGVMRQHHVGIIGFGFFLICQIIFTYTIIVKTKNSINSTD